MLSLKDGQSRRASAVLLNMDSFMSKVVSVGKSALAVIEQSEKLEL
jgi:hypothetical protein